MNEISGTLGIKNETAKKYLNALEATFVIKLVAPFFRNVRKEITKMPKVYFIDNGLCNFSFPPPALLGFSKDYQIKKAIIVNLSLTEQIEKNGLNIQYVLPEELNKIINS